MGGFWYTVFISVAVNLVVIMIISTTCVYTTNVYYCYYYYYLVVSVSFLPIRLLERVLMSADTASFIFVIFFVSTSVFAFVFYFCVHQRASLNDEIVIFLLQS